jgi:hypothetical protein
LVTLFLPGRVATVATLPSALFEERKSASGNNWKQETADNDHPLTEVEVERMKAFLRRNAPTSYFTIFAKAKTDR